MVEGGIRNRRLDIVEILVHRPGDDALVLQGIGNCESIQHPGSILADTVPYGPPFLPYVFKGVGPCHLLLNLLLVVVLLAGFGAQAVVPCQEGFAGTDGRIPVVQRIEHISVGRILPGMEGIQGLHEGVVRSLEGIADDAVRERVDQSHIETIAERIRLLQGIGNHYGVAGRKARNGIVFILEVDGDT